MRSITITQGESGWNYAFEGIFSVRLLGQATKGVLRGWRRHAATLKREEAKVNPPEPRPDRRTPIPAVRPGENLGHKPQASMPFDQGLGISPHAPTREPDAASMQPHPMRKESTDEPVQQRETDNAGGRESKPVDGREVKQDSGESNPPRRKDSSDGETSGEDILTTISGEPKREFKLPNRGPRNKK